MSTHAQQLQTLRQLGMVPSAFCCGGLNVSQRPCDAAFGLQHDAICSLQSMSSWERRDHVPTFLRGGCQCSSRLSALLSLTSLLFLLS
jgi:hypothetical protein